MSEHVTGLNRTQTALFPDTLEEYVDKDNPVRFIDAFIDNINLEKLGFTHSTTNELGRPSYDPSDLLKLYIYGYLNQVRTSRKLEHECHRNIEVIYLTKKLAPDFKTIADFRKDNVDCIKGVFKEFVKFYMGLDLYGAKYVAIDGVKFKAVNSLDRNFNRDKLSYRLRVIEERVSKYLCEMEALDKQEEKAEATRELEEKLKNIMKYKEKYTDLLRKLKKSELERGRSEETAERISGYNQ